MLKVGLIVCAHGNAKAVARLKKQYEKNNADIIAILGDLGDTAKEIDAVLRAARSKLPTIVFPGNHEPAQDYYHAVKKHRRIIECSKKQRISFKGYDFLLLPSANVTRPEAGFRVFEGKRVPAAFLRQFKPYFIAKLAKLVRNPAKTVVLSHSPPRCSGNNAIDVAYSGIVSKSFTLRRKDANIFGKKYAQPLTLIPHGKGEIMPAEEGLRLAGRGYPVAVRHRNVGLKELTAFLKNKCINFLACGHIHEAGQRAVSAAGKTLRQGEWNSSVWYNAASALRGKGGLLIIDNDKATFKNIKA
jgi:Icc-related predicted phosphoesterase